MAHARDEDEAEYGRHPTPRVWFRIGSAGDAPVALLVFMVDAAAAMNRDAPRDEEGAERMFGIGETSDADASRDERASGRA
jgi:hypothetical protein